MITQKRKSVYEQFTIVANVLMELLERQLFSWMLVSNKALLEELPRTSDALLLNSLVYTRGQL